ncbi:MAG: DUF5687 family protein [Rhodothermales bacterium]
MHIYLLLIQNHWKYFWRSVKTKHRWITIVAVGLVLIYLTFVLVGMGLFFKDVLRGSAAGDDPIGFINRYLIEIFIGLFSLRFFLQQGPKIKMQPYLHLPISRKRLVYFFQAFSLLSFHNIIPYLFFIPFSIRYLAKGYPGMMGAGCWLAGITMILLISHYTNNLLRAILNKNTWFYVLTISFFASLLVLDQLINTQLLQYISEILFDELLRGNLLLLALLTSLAVSIILYSSALIQQNLLSSPTSGASPRSQRGTLVFAPGRGQVLNLILLELKMIWRNKRPKHYFLLSVVFAVAYIALMLTESQVFSSRAISAIIGIFASGTFALNYGQLMFSWESMYFDGFLARNIRPEEFILAKLMILQGSCLVFFLISLPLFIILSPNLLLLHVTFLFYNAGVTSVLMLALAVRNQRRVNISKSGSFFNYEGFSAMHWLWILPTITPPAILLYFLQNITWTALLFIGGIGVTSLVLSKRWSLYFTERLLDKKYVMASGFRQYES